MVGPIAKSRTHDGRLGLGDWSLPLAALALCLATATIAFWDTLASLVILWANSDAYGHGFFIVPIAAYLIWRRRDLVMTLESRPAPLGLVLTLAACLVWLVSEAAAIALVSQLAFVAILQSLVLTILGWRVVAVLLFPLAYLYLMVPFGDFLIPSLQDLTAEAVVRMLRVLDIPVFIDGIFLSIPTGNFEIAEACAGLRFMIATVVLGLVYAHLVYESLWRQVLFMALAIVVTIVANWLRALGIVVVAYATDHEVAVGVDHLVYGSVFLSIVILILFLLGLTFRDREIEPSEVNSGQPPITTTSFHPSGRVLATSALGAMILLAVTSVYAAQITGKADRAYHVTLEAPTIAPPWVRREGPGSDWSPEYVNADRELLARYRSEEKVADLYVAFYADQREGAEVVNIANKPANGERWARLEDTQVDLSLGGDAVSGIGTVLQSADGSKRLVVRWFWVDGVFTASPQVAKLIQVRAIVLDRQRAAAAILISAPFEEDVETAAETLRSVVAAMPNLEATLNEASTRALAADQSALSE